MSTTRPRILGPLAAITGGITLLLALPVADRSLSSSERVLAQADRSIPPTSASQTDIERTAPRGDRQTDGPYPPLENVPLRSARDQGVTTRDDDLVMGVEIRGASRAYPLCMMNTPDRHVINDWLGGQPIAVTWCGLCQSPVVFGRRVAGKELVLFVPGELYSENLLIQDVQTGSEWPQLIGKAVSGPLKGEALERLPAVWTDWRTWRAEHPETTVVDLPRTTDGLHHDPGYASPDAELHHFAAFQWGVALDGKALSWPFPDLHRSRVVNDALAGEPFVIVFDDSTSTVTSFDRRLGSLLLTFHRDRDRLTDDRTGSVWNPVTGQAIEGSLKGSRLKPIAGVVSQVRAWRIFHPESAVRTAHAG